MSWMTSVETRAILGVVMSPDMEPGVLAAARASAREGAGAVVHGVGARRDGAPAHQEAA